MTAADYTDAEFAVALQQVYGYRIKAYAELLHSACSCCNDLEEDVLGETLGVVSVYPPSGTVWPGHFEGYPIIDSKGIRDERELWAGFGTSSFQEVQFSVDELTVSATAVAKAVAHIQAHPEKYNAWSS